ncbi:MAG: ABC transporter ATP-binding protein [Candidatus Berkiellales bacterium]
MSDHSIPAAIKKLVSLLSGQQKLQLIKMMSLSFCTSILEMITATMIVVLAQVINKPTSGQKYLSLIGWDNLSPSHIILTFALSMGLIYLVKNCLAVFEVIYQHFSIQRINYRFKKTLLQRYAQVDYNYYLTRNSSQGYAVISSDADLTFSNGMVSLTMIFSETVIFLSLIAMIIFIDPRLAAMIFGIGAILGIILKKFLFPLFYRWGSKIQEYALHGEKNLLQFFHAFKEIVLIGKRDVFIDAYHFYSRKRSKIQAIQNVTNILPRMVTELLFVTLFILTITYFCLGNEDPQKLVGILGGYLYVGFRVMPGLNRIITQLNTFKSMIPCIDRVYQEYHFTSEKEHIVDCPDFQFNHNIILKNVSFRYLKAHQDALFGINLAIKKGECVGITGETGSGKSTLSDMILGLLKPREGTIAIDDQYPVNSFQWHACIGYVQQSIYLIDDTIKANIAFGVPEEKIDYTKLAQAINGAQLNALIDQLPQGVETIVGERGMRLSGGERQRIAVARALYRDPKVFIFDEATSALDNDTETRLMETIDTIRQSKRTIIIIAHRLTTLKNCDRIIVMKNGRIDKILSYEQLIANDNQRAQI